MSARYTHDALRDLDQISSYLADYNIAAAASLLEAVEALASRLDRFPYSAQQTEIPGVRAAPLLRFPCIVFYTVESDGVVIHYVRHAARLRPWEKR